MDDILMREIISYLLLFSSLVVKVGEIESDSNKAVRVSAFLIRSDWFWATCSLVYISKGR